MDGEIYLGQIPPVSNTIKGTVGYPYTHIATVAPMSPSEQAGWGCSMQSPALEKIIDVPFPIPSSLHSTSSTMKAIEEGVSWSV